MSKSPAPSSIQARNRMVATRQRNTTSELVLRRALHAAGLRYRLHRSVLPGLRRHADLVFGPRRVAVFVDGCFWHGCPIHATYPKANESWWRDKLETNQRRDRDTDRRLADAGWLVVRVWEHESSIDALARIVVALDSRCASDWISMD